MRSIFGGLGVLGVLLSLATPVSAEVLLQAGATETKLVTAETHRPMRHQLTAEVGQTVVIRLKLANNNPGIVSRVAVYAAGKYTPLAVDNQVSYRTVDPTQKSQISHLVVLTLPGEQQGTQMNYEIEPLFDYDSEPTFRINNSVESANVGAPSTVRYRMTVETATVSQRLLLEAQTLEKQQDYQDAIATYTRAINLNPEIADFYTQRGRAYLSLNEQTHEALSQAIVTDWETAAQLYEQVGHSVTANALRWQINQVVESNDSRLR